MKSKKKLGEAKSAYVELTNSVSFADKGEAIDAYTVLEWFKRNWEWIGDFEPYPEGHEQHGYPNTEGFNPTTRNLLKLAASCNIKNAL